jgi:hypothetical protein
MRDIWPKLLIVIKQLKVAVTSLQASRSQTNNTTLQHSQPRRVKTAQNSQRGKARKATLVTYSRAVKGGVLPWPWSIQFGDGYCGKSNRDL